MKNESEIQQEKFELLQLDPLNAPEILEYRKRNRDFFDKYIPTKPDSFYTIKGISKTLWWEQEQMEEGKGYREWLVLNNRIIGDFSLANIYQNELSSAELGYKIDRDYTGKGIAGKALKTFIPNVFKKFRINRIVAHTMTDNKPSISLLEKTGFIKEGIAREFLLVNGKRRDHYQYSLLKKDYE